MSDTFGFEAAAPKKSTKERLASIKPSAPDNAEVPLAAIDAVADAQGFTSREPAKPELVAPTVRKRRRDAGPRVAVNMMVPEPVAAPFIKFCEDNRYTYWEGVHELMKRAKIV